MATKAEKTCRYQLIRSCDNTIESSPFLVTIACPFAALSLLTCSVLAFVVGHAGRVFWDARQDSLLLIPPLFLQWQGNFPSIPRAHHEGTNRILAPPPADDNDEVASMLSEATKSQFLSKQTRGSGGGQEEEFDILSYHLQKNDNGHCIVGPDGSACYVNSTNRTEDHKGRSAVITRAALSEGMGEHLLMDLHVGDDSSKLLRSEDVLEAAMLDLVREAGFTLLSRHCHSSASVVACVGLLTEPNRSHISFHAWPTRSAISVDIFATTCGNHDEQTVGDEEEEKGDCRCLFRVVPIIEKLFLPKYLDHSVLSLQKSRSKQQSQMIWAHKRRGWSGDGFADLSDFSSSIGEMSGHRKLILSAKTDLQRVDIVDVVSPTQFQSLVRHYKTQSQDGDSHEPVAADRLVYLDGILQSRQSSDAAYHEALVHPAMFAHDNPKRVAIIGGGEGATLREVLKHLTVETVVMVEIDEDMVTLSRKYLHDWNDCSHLKTKAPTNSCFDDPRVELYFEDAFAWFVDRFGIDNDGDHAKEEPFDVIIMDALDPEIENDFVDALYDGGPFLRSIPEALTDEGIFIGQVGTAPAVTGPAEEHSLAKNRAKFIRSLVDLGFESILDYEEGHCGFGSPWQFVIAFKEYDSRANWFVSEAEVNLKIRKRSIPSTRIEGASPFLYFDGATMQSYMHPSKGSEVVFCRGESSPAVCQHGFDPARPNFLLSEVAEVKASSLGEKAGRGLFAKRDIPQESYVGLEIASNPVRMSPASYDLIVEMQTHEIADGWGADELEAYSHAYGHIFSRYGRNNVVVDTSSHCFINHGCHGSNNMGHDLSTTEASSDPGNISPEVLDQYFGKRNVYNPLAERQVHFFSSAIPRRYIKAGEEFFDNYLGMVGIDEDGWREDVLSLREQCSGRGVGEVKEYEMKSI